MPIAPCVRSARTAGSPACAARVRGDASILPALALALALFALVAPPLASGRTAPPLPTVEFWTLTPNEGQSSGGHSAIRIDESIYHFEHRGDGLIQIRRDARRPFERAYRGRGNRSIDVLRLDLSADVIRNLSRTLRARTLAESIRMRRLESIEEDLRLVEQMLDQDAATVSVPALGLFDEGRDENDCFTRLGFAETEFLERALRSELDQAFSSRRSALARASGTALNESRNPGSSLTHGLHEAATLVEAMDALRRCRLVKPEFLTPIPRNESRPFDERVWREIDASLRADLARLVSSTRPDRGLAILLTWGRIQAARASLSRGQVVLLDSFDEAEPADRPRSSSALPEAWLLEREREAGLAREAALTALQTRWPERPVEPMLDRLERVQHDHVHAERHTAHRRSEPIGLLKTTRALERRPREVTLRSSSSDRDDLLREKRSNLLRLRTREFASLREEARYALLTQNCVTELLEVLDDSMATNPTTVAFANDRKRDWESGFTFVPVAAHRIVARNAPIESRTSLPSAYHLALARERASTDEGFDLARRLREMSPWTSKHYRPHPADSTFLVFTDRTIWTRPLGGVVNVASSTLLGAVGVLTLPFDRGKRLRDAAMGITMSVPELFFFNIRKGSYPITPPGSLLAPTSDP